MEKSSLSVPDRKTNQSAGRSPDAGPSSQRIRPNVSTAASAKVRRRNRLITSCLECRRRKLKCDKSHPCTNCTKFNRDCVFLAPALDAASQQKLNQIKEQMGSLERTLEDEIARRNIAAEFASTAHGVIADDKSSSEDEGPVVEDEQDLEPTPLALDDAAFDENADDETVDLGVMIGKLRFTERLGGFVRPKFGEEMSYILKERYEPAVISEEAASRALKSEPDVDNTSSDTYYTVPSSSFFFAAEPQKSSLMLYLPSKNVADGLLDHYWTAVYPVCRLVHRPSFERQWNMFWQQVHSGVEPVASLQALVLGCLFSATLSMTDQTVSRQFGVTRSELMRSFQQGTEYALCRANFLRTTKFQTLQALVLYLTPMCRRDVTRAHSTLVATAVRLAECMGLHRDGTYYGFSPLDTHLRRMVWHELCFLDMRTTEATGPRPLIDADEYDTKLPLNVDDRAFESPNPPTRDSPHWTDITLCRMRWEMNEMHRFVWKERGKIDKKKVSITNSMRKVQESVTKTERWFYGTLDNAMPLARLAFMMFKSMYFRADIMFLHRYVSLPGRPMPEKLRKRLLISTLLQGECAMCIETEASLRPWAWYLGAIHQYHSSLILLAETYASEVRYHEDRAWRVLDYVFECPPTLTRKEKAKLILSQLSQKFEDYQASRRLRAPAEVNRNLKYPPDQHFAALKRLSHYPDVHSSKISEGSSIDQIANQMDYRSWHLNTPGSTGAMSQQWVSDAAAMTTSNPNSNPMGSPHGSLESFASNEPMIDVDWQEWDRMFPPEQNTVADFGNLPDFQFSMLFPQGTGQD